MIRLGMLDLQEAKRVRSILADRGVELVLKHDAESCGSGGCKPQVEVHAREEDVPRVVELFREEQARTFAGLEIDPELLEQVFDPSQETARCPACGTSFSTKASECPDCGLGGFGAAHG